MNIKRGFCLVLAAAFLALERVQAVDLTVNLTYPLPITVAVAVSTFPVKDPPQALNPSVFLSSASVTFSSVGSHAFNGLPLFGAPTTYYVYAFADVNGDGKPSGAEPMGGYGPFPGLDLAASTQAFSAGDAKAVTCAVTQRAEIAGTLLNPSSQPGERLVIRAMDVNLPPEYIQALAFAPSGGPFGYSLPGLKPSTNYVVEAWVDTQPEGQPGAFNPDTFEDKAMPQGPFGLTDGQILTGIDLVISSGAVGGSTPDHIRLAGANNTGHQVISSGTASGPITASIRDFNDAPTSTSTPTTVQFNAFTPAGFDPAPLVSLDGFSSTAAFVVIPASQPFSPPFQFKSLSTGPVTLRAEAVNFPVAGQSRFSYYSFDVLAGGAGFTNLVVRSVSQPLTATGTAVTITPDRDGTDDAAVLQTLPPNPNLFWELLIATDTSFSGPVVKRFFGSGPGQVYWHGEGFDGRVVPNGAYFARFQTQGAGLVSSTLTVNVVSQFIKGAVTNGQGVAVRAFGQGGGGFALTGPDGKFFIGGLKLGAPYTVEFTKPGLAPKTSTGVVASADLGNVPLDPGATIAVQVTVGTGPFQDLYGHVFVHNADYSSTANGPLRLRAGETISDNGLPAADPGFSNFTYLGVEPGTAYNLRVEMPQYGVFVATGITAVGGSTTSVPVAMVRKANIFGLVQFSSAVNTPFGGDWVSVDALPAGAAAGPTAWGGVFMPNGSSTGVYKIFGVDPGTYTLRAFARGFVPNTFGPIVVGTADIGDQFLGGADFAPFDQGGVITGTITINGDSSGLNFGGFGGGCPGAGQVPVHINAISRATFTNAFSQVCLSTSATPTSAPFLLTGLPDGDYELHSYIPGFQKTPPGPLAVTVSSGAGTGSLVFNPLSGRLNIIAALPAGDNPNLVFYNLRNNGPDGADHNGFFFAGPGGTGLASVNKLSTGLYQLSVLNGNPNRGLRRALAVAVTNGSTTTVNVDMTVPTVGLSGAVTVQGNLILSSTWSVTVSSMAGLAAAGVAPMVNVYAFPLPEHFRGDTEPLRRLPVAVHETSGTFSMTGLTAGGYLLRLQEDLNPPLPSCAGCMATPGLPELASTDRVVFVGTAAAAAVDLVVSNGGRVSGTISRPVGDTSSDARAFLLRLRRSDNLSVWETEANTTGAGGAAYEFPHLAAGNYILEVMENSAQPKYAAPAQGITIGAGDETLDVSLVVAATIVGQLRDADTDTLLTAMNAGQFLPNNFGIFAQANPWVPGGFAEAERGGAGPQLDASGRFRIARLIPETVYDVTLRGFESLGQQSLAQGQRTYAPKTIGGLRVGAGQVLDLGIVDLKQGGTLSGAVRDAAGAALANVRVTGLPSLTNGASRHNFSVEAFTDANGKYELQGIDRAQNYYDIIAARRFSSNEIFSQLAGPRYAEERLRQVDVNDPAAAVDNDFTLVQAGGALTGRVTTADGGALVPPFARSQNQQGLRGANVVLHFNGAPLDDNPLGEIEEFTDADGVFRVAGLKPGAYTFRAIAVGYGTHMRTVTVAASGDTAIGTITLAKGASISGTITKPDGTAPSTGEVGKVVGVDNNFEDFVFGLVESNADTDLVTGYSLTGFQAGKNYSLVMVTEKDEIIEAASGVVFSTTTENRVVNLVYRPAGPKVFVNQARVGDTYTLRFFTSQPLRDLTAADDDLSTIATSAGGGINYSSSTIAASRDFITVVYDADPTEASFPITLDFFTNAVDPDSATGENFRFTKTFEFFTGIGKRRSVDIPNVTGGECSLEGVPAGATFESGAFDVAGSSTIEVGIQSAGTLEELPPAAPGLRSPGARRASWAAGTVQRLGRRAFPSDELFKAVALAPAVNPFSAFYDIFLPAGINHMLNKDALITLQYDESIADPTTLNVYYFDPNNDVFLLERGERSIDTVNRTITVAVNHLSTFVVLQSQAPIIGAGGFTGQEILVHNVPNPFNLKPKTVTLNDAVPPQTQATDGTVIKYALPTGKSGRVKIEIYDIAGSLVKVIEQDAPTDANYYYTDWDGKNDAGNKVASGVYIARFTLNGGDEKFFKMAVVK